MIFLAMIIALLLTALWDGSNPLQRDDWFVRLRASIGGLGLAPAPTVVLLVLIPTCLAALLLGALESLLFGALWIAAAACLLLYSLGRRNYKDLADRYRGACLDPGVAEDAREAFAAAELGGVSDAPADEEQNDEEEPAAPDPLQAHYDVHGAITYAGYEGWFAVLFYFVLLGPVAALAYRLLQLSREPQVESVADRALFYLDWVPVRLLALTFALTGDFMGSGAPLRRSLAIPDVAAPDLLLEVGRAAIHAPAREGEVDPAELAGEVGAMGELLTRSAGVWLVVISVLVLFT